MNDPAVISLCDKTGIMVAPWAEAGFPCICVDIQHSIRRDRTEGNITFTWGDVRSWCPPARPLIVFAFPPCTDLAVSGARDFKKKGVARLCDALTIFNACLFASKWSGAPYMVENPVSTASSYIESPQSSFQPWMFGDNWTKKTCLWTGNGFVLPSPLFSEKANLFSQGKPDGVTEKIWKMSPSDERANLRAETPPEFARAVFNANVGMVSNRRAA